MIALSQRPSALTLVLAAILVAIGVFALWPGLDLWFAGGFFASGRFTGRTATGEFWRQVFYYLPYLLLFGLLALALLKRLGCSANGPDRRAVLFLVGTLALGPGLLVNGVLKEVSHRPRPEQSQQFGGPWTFRPMVAFDGACQRNCSFVSGEVATAAWTLAPALLAPPAVKALAVAAALVFTAAVALLRMAFGGHYLSDALFAALFTLLIVLAGFRWYRRKR
jgi:membrane-associated phospholipid phosphatase